MQTDQVGCQHGDIKLVNGSNPNEGRVEICINNQWGTVTDDGWSSNETQVVCRQLGYSTDGKTWKQLKLKSSSNDILATLMCHAGVQYSGSAYFGQGNGSIFLDNVTCNGSEASLLSCSYTAPTSSDSHSEDVGVKCQGQQCCTHNIHARRIILHVNTHSCPHQSLSCINL